MAPEYVYRGHFSFKSDVYSFGVLVLEIVSGQKASSQNGVELDNLVGYVSIYAYLNYTSTMCKKQIIITKHLYYDISCRLGENGGKEQF